jgi:SRSO17 transposase
MSSQDFTHQDFTHQDFTHEDERRFEAYMDALSVVLNHEQRIVPLKGYCTGLLLPVEGKTMETIAAHLAPDRTLAMHHSLQNFIADAPWSDAAMFDAVRAQVLPAMLERGAIRSWIVDDTGIPKKGHGSVGVSRQYCGQLGKVDNCQVLVTLSIANEVAALPAAARLYLPEAWVEDDERRTRAGVPLDVPFQTKPAIALDQIRAAHAAGVPPGVVLADAAYGANAAFRRGVSDLGLSYAVAVPGGVRVVPPADRRQARRFRGRGGPMSARDAAALLGRAAWRWVTWREGTGPELTGRFAMMRVRVVLDDGPDAREEDQTLLVEWPVGEPDPVGYWLVTLPSGTPLATVIATAKDRWWIERGYRELKRDVGLRDFQGRGWRGFHHHVTLCVAAYGFLVMRRCRHPLAGQVGSPAGNLRYPSVTDPNNPPVRTERHVPWSIRTLRKRLTVGLARRLSRCPCCQASHPLIPDATPIKRELQ